MPTALRTIIFVGELIGFALFSVFVVIKLCKKDNQGVKKNINERRKFYVVYFIINNIIILSLFLFSYPTFIFLSYNKMLFLSVIIVCSILSGIGIFLIFSKENISGFINVVLAFIITITFCYISAAVDGLEDKICLGEKESTETILPYMVDEMKVGYITDVNGNINTYFYFYKDEKGKRHFEKVTEEVVIYIPNNKDCYVEKHTVTKRFLNKEKKTSAEDYLSTEEKVTYTLYLNKEQLIELKTD